MLTRLVFRNFKRFREADVKLGHPVVFIGPNNSGKTSALQALSLWHIGVQRWLEKRGKEAPEKRPGVAINRRDLLAIPVPDANLLWRDLHVRQTEAPGKALGTQNVRIEILVEGVTEFQPWHCGLEFDYANPESFYCRPLRNAAAAGDRMAVPEQAGRIKVAYLPPMSGLASQEVRLDPGAVNVRIGEGRTAEVLRNLCYQIVTGGPERAPRWNELAAHIEALFGLTLNQPEYIQERGEITMSYRERGCRFHLDISAAGRGLHQTLLVLAYLYANPQAVLLLDEPDAHLEILRQREIYRLLTEVAARQGSQVIAASHSEVLLNEAADRHLVIVFVGRPHSLADRGTQVRQALRTFGFEHYYQAENRGWVLYLDGPTDLAVLKAFADSLRHPAAEALERPFVYYVQNRPKRAREHFIALREAKPDLLGIALFDRLQQPPESLPGLRMLAWERCEIENYFLYPEVLLAYAGKFSLPLFAESLRRTMEECIRELVPPAALQQRDDPWWSEVRAGEFLDGLFREFFSRLAWPNLMDNSDYRDLARLTPAELIAPEVREKLDAVAEVAAQAHPAEEP